MGVVNALQLSQGAKVDPLYGNTFTGASQPYQMIPMKEKTPDWAARTMDYIEWSGLKQLRRNAGKLLKAYKLGNAQIDKADYVIEESDYAEMIEPLIKEDISALELRFYPIIPTIIDVLTNEFSKRYSRLTFETKDDKSANEMLQEKYEEIEKVLVQQATIKQQLKLQELGVDINSDQFKQETSPEQIKTLPQIQEFYAKDYKSVYTQWAEHQMVVDNDRFSMPELERLNFRNSLITDREFWHFKMNEDDYDIQVWNPVQVFYRKSPNTRYLSDASWVGMVTLMTPSDVLDSLGWMMSKEQMDTFNISYPIRGALYSQTGWGNENGAYYDKTMPYEWNTQGPGVGMRQLMSAYHDLPLNGDAIKMILAESEDLQDVESAYLIRVSTIYWKTQRLMGHLTKIDANGNLIQDIVTEDYKVFDKPLYNTLLYKEKTKENLIFGDHIDWFWMTESYGGIKVGPNIPGFVGMNNPNGFSPMYIGMNGGKPGKLKYQFKGGKTSWGCKLPVEGRIFNDYNTHSKSLVEKLKPYQVGYNMVLNQIQDIQIDELGTILVFDQRTLPRHSMGEDWGDANIEKAYVAAKNFSMIPIDTSILNTDTAIQQMPFQKIDMSQHERIMSKIKQAQWIKEEALSSIGLNPQRMGTPIDREQTATGVQEAIAASYAQTEQYFIQHSDELMPRVHQMRTDLAQYYQSNNPSIRLQYTTKEDEKIFFMLDGKDLIGRDINVTCKTRVGMSNILENIKQMMLKDNTTKSNLWDRIRAIKADDMSDLEIALNKMEAKDNQLRQQEAQAEQEAQKAEQEHEMALLKEKQAWESAENDKKLRSQEYQAELKSAGMSGAVDLNQNKENDYLDNLKFIQGQQEHSEKMSLERDKHLTNTRLKEADQQIAEQKLSAENKRTAAELSIAKLSHKAKEHTKTKK